jgi:Fe-Mn family superoxide dismutase
MNRREFLGAAAAASVLMTGIGRAAEEAVAPKAAQKSASPQPAAFVPPALPYAMGALEPTISARTLSFHYGKHHAAYAAKLSASTYEKEPWHGMAVEDIVAQSAGKPDAVDIFNNAAQFWNHTFYWNSMKPGGGGAPEGKMAELIEESFKSYETFREEFSKAAASQFGSGWAWLALKDGKIRTMKTSNADTPLAHGIRPILTIDVWEHAYYLDYQERRGDYIAAWLENLVNWDFALKNIEAAG